jgi:hypothetical protein
MTLDAFDLTDILDQADRDYWTGGGWAAGL